MPSSSLTKLAEIRAAAGPRVTVGLSDATLASFLATDPSLAAAIDDAHAAWQVLRQSYASALALDERELGRWIQSDLLPFYGPDAVNPYVPIGARGPWIITSHGGVVHDSGGYGMLGFGHGPQAVIDAMSKPWVMANLMTPSFSQKRFLDAIEREIGHTRGGCPYAQFVCLNSGSEANSVALRITDALARRMTDPGGAQEGKRVKLLAIQGGFHGRTDRPAQASHSSYPTYTKTLRTFRDHDYLTVVPSNDVAALREAFAQAERDGVWFEAMLLEPVMGEGAPGVATSRAFYDEARRLTKASGTVLLVDSIQAGLRVHGTLSFVDYPDFTDAEPPDMEVYSKAINAAQYPLSVLALTESAASLYRAGLYGNTMTTNPRALEIATTVLGMITPALRENIRARGAELLTRLTEVAEEFHPLTVRAQGTGLLLALELDATHAKVTGFGGVEEACRLRGMGVIHGGANALRFTPHFAITSAEVDLMIGVLRDTLATFARAAAVAK